MKLQLVKLGIMKRRIGIVSIVLVNWVTSFKMMVEDVNTLNERLTQQILNGLKASTLLIHINPNTRKKPLLNI